MREGVFFDMEAAQTRRYDLNRKIDPSDSLGLERLGTGVTAEDVMLLSEEMIVQDTHPTFIPPIPMTGTDAIADLNSSNYDNNDIQSFFEQTGWDQLREILMSAPEKTTSWAKDEHKVWPTTKDKNDPQKTVWELMVDDFLNKYDRLERQKWIKDKNRLNTALKTATTEEQTFVDRTDKACKVFNRRELRRFVVSIVFAQVLLRQSLGDANAPVLFLSTIDQERLEEKDKKMSINSAHKIMKNIADSLDRATKNVEWLLLGELVAVCGAAF
jgi:hypothetical protein